MLSGRSASSSKHLVHLLNRSLDKAGKKHTLLIVLPRHSSYRIHNWCDISNQPDLTDSPLLGKLAKAVPNCAHLSDALFSRLVWLAERGDGVFLYDIPRDELLQDVPCTWSRTASSDCTRLVFWYVDPTTDPFKAFFWQRLFLDHDTYCLCLLCICAAIFLESDRS